MNRANSKIVPYPLMGLGRKLADRHPKTGHDVEGFTLDQGLNILAVKVARLELTAKDGFETKDSDFSQRAPVVARAPLPSAAGRTANGAQVLVTGQWGPSAVAMLQNAGITAGRDGLKRDTQALAGVIETQLVISPIRRHQINGIRNPRRSSEIQVRLLVPHR